MSNIKLTCKHLLEVAEIAIKTEINDRNNNVFTIVDMVCNEPEYTGKDKILFMFKRDNYITFKTSSNNEFIPDDEYTLYVDTFIPNKKFLYRLECSIDIDINKDSDITFAILDMINTINNSVPFIKIIACPNNIVLIFDFYYINDGRSFHDENSNIFSISESIAEAISVISSLKESVDINIANIINSFNDKENNNSIINDLKLLVDLGIDSRESYNIFKVLNK